MSARVWFARDTGLTSDPKVQPLGDEHGPGAILAIEEIMALAKLKGNGGSMSTSYATLARRSFISPAKAKLVVADACEAGIIEVTEGSCKAFSATLLKWARWQIKDPNAARRKAEQRSRESHADVTPDVTGRSRP